MKKSQVLKEQLKKIIRSSQNFTDRFIGDELSKFERFTIFANQMIWVADELMEAHDAFIDVYRDALIHMKYIGYSAYCEELVDVAYAACTAFCVIGHRLEEDSEIDELFSTRILIYDWRSFAKIASKVSVEWAATNPSEPPEKLKVNQALMALLEKIPLDGIEQAVDTVVAKNDAKNENTHVFDRQTLKILKLS